MLLLNSKTLDYWVEYAQTPEAYSEPSGTSKIEFFLRKYLTAESL